MSDSEKSNYELGVEYYDDRYIDTAASYFRKGAEEGDTDAMYRLGRMYQEEEIPGGILEAFRLFRDAAEEDHIDAMVALAYLYKDGFDRYQSWYRALEWFERAQSLSGHCYQDQIDECQEMANRHGRTY